MEAGASGPLVEAARTELYRGQCNCSYWHGAFGGVYLPHLRRAVEQFLIRAERGLDRLEGGDPSPGRARLLRTLGWVKGHADRHEEAISLLEQAIARKG